MLEFHLKLPFPIEHPQTLKILERAREQSVLLLLLFLQDLMGKFDMFKAAFTHGTALCD